MRYALRVTSIIAIAAMLVVWLGGAASAKNSTPQNVDVSKRLGNESEEAIAVNPTNPKNIVIFTNIAEGVNGMFLAVSFDGGQTQFHSTPFILTQFSRVGLRGFEHSGSLPDPLCVY